VSAATYFIAGTDTGVGKTRVTAALLAAGREQGLTVAGMKPVAAGSDDARQLASASGQATAYEDLNPYCFKEAVSPHIAADRAKIVIDIDKIAAISRRLQAGCDLLLIEGAGGWHAPISAQESMADIARALASPVILVVGLRLGCLSHARLTLEAIERSDCRFGGWIANQIDPEFELQAENLATLRQLMRAAPLAIMPYALGRTHDAAQVRAALRLLLSR